MNKNPEDDNKSEDLWTPYKKLYHSIQYHLSSQNAENIKLMEFNGLLKQFKQSFFALLQNPPKNIKNREELKKGMEDGITIKGIGHQVLSRDLYDEVIILSDMYNLNEFLALDLLCTAQLEMPYYYGLPRGLVAVLLYYEGRQYLVMSLRLLVRARSGISWTSNIEMSLVQSIMAYTDQLMESGLFDRIFELLKSLDLSKEMEKLQDNVALGGPRHRRQVTDLFNKTKSTLAEIVFLWSAQSGLTIEPTVGLINFLRQLNIEEDAAGKLDDVSFYLLLALLYAMDLSVLHTRENGEEILQNLPILSPKEYYVQMLCMKLSPTEPKWTSEGLQAVALFGLAVTSACLRLIPTKIQVPVEQELQFLSAAIEMKIFEFFNTKLLTCETLYIDEIQMRRVHYLLTDFIVQIFPRVKELHFQANTTARLMQAYFHEGVEPPTNLPRHFESIMQTVSTFYSKDPLNLQYSLEFWCPLDTTLNELYSYRAPPRSVSLFKFIKLASNLVPIALFVPFLNMLSALSSCPQAARNCFNILKQTDSGFGSTVSWDHFFLSFSQYYANLKQKAAITTGTVYHHGVHPKGITPQELAGLHVVLKLIRTVAEQDDVSRLALCEHPGWAPLTVLLGLVSCGIPIPLKADLLLTLAALSKSPESASQMWTNIEASQILVTVPSTSTFQLRGIQTELDEIESRNEEYPLTRSLLVLLDVLTDYGIPRMLGAGSRKPGFDPYLTFVINSVFLKFNTRAYRNAEERWMVCSLCLKLLEKFLNQYEPQLSDFPSNNKTNDLNSPPGFHIMVQLNLKSEFLNLILFIIEEGGKLFQQFVSFPSQNYIKECTLKCLNILERALSIQGTFFSLLSASSSSLLLTNLSKLLLTINPRSGQSDHCLNISKYVSYCYLLPKHVLVAVKILLYVTSSSLSSHSQYLNILLSNQKDAILIRNGFVELLDTLQSGKDEDNVINLTKEAILKLLKQCLSYNTPNLSHFLLGFDMKHDISQTLFQQPGVLGFPRTCLHSTFTILSHVFAKEAPVPSATLLESTYNMVYLLCLNQKTSEPILRFIRQDQTFFKEHLEFCTKNVNNGVSCTNQLSWLLKTIAIELKLSCNKNQTFYLQRLIKSLIDVPVVVSKDATPPVPETQNTNKNEGSESKSENILIKLIENFDFKIEEIVVPKWDYFDLNVLEGLLKSCQTDPTSKLIDIKKLHYTLMNEISTLQANTAIGQRQAILGEVQKVLLHALSINNVQSSSAAITRFVDSWRQIVEVLASFLPYQVLSPLEQQILSIDIMKSICEKVLEVNLLPEVANYFSSALLLLMENVKKCQLKRLEIADEKTDAVAINLPVKSLKIILHRILTWMLNSTTTEQNLRINLYTSLITFLKLIKLEEPKEENTSTTLDSFYVSRLDSSRIQTSSEDNMDILYIPTDILLTFGEKLVELLCQDCIGGHNMGKMLAMSTFSMLLNMTGNNNWIVYMGGRGYLKHIIQSILESDEELKLLLEPVPQTLKPLYLYISKMSLLAQIASTKVGAELLLEQQILSCLSSMKVFGSHPDVLKQSQLPPKELAEFIPTVEMRYLQIFLPTLQLCNAIITSLNTENYSAVSQVMYYLTSNLDVVEFILRSGSPLLSLDFLEELSCLTMIIGRIASANMTFLMENADNIQDYRVYLHRIQKHMLTLLPRFLLTDEIIKDLSLDINRLLYAFQIITNLITYSKNIIANNNVFHTAICTIFQPQLGDNFSGFNNKSNHTDQSPNIGTIVQHLINTVNYYHEEKHRMQKEHSSYCIYIIENSLYIIWAHLDYYMLKAIPKTKFGESSELNSTFSSHDTLASASEATWKVSTDDISSLKYGLASIFNDNFSKQLIGTTQESPDIIKAFVETLLRKIKRLIQFVPVQ